VVIVWKHQTGVNQYHVAQIFKDGHILADSVQPTQGDYLQFCLCRGGFSGVATVLAGFDSLAGAVIAAIITATVTIVVCLPTVSPLMILVAAVILPVGIVVATVCGMAFMCRLYFPASVQR
jgi:hypothetical protein